jgi:hypothetical protein
MPWDERGREVNEGAERRIAWCRLLAGVGKRVMGVRVHVPSLQLHALDVAHDDGHLGAFGSLCEQGGLVEVGGCLAGSLAGAVAVGAVLEAGVSLGLAAGLLLVHGGEERVLLLLGLLLGGHAEGGRRGEAGGAARGGNGRGGGGLEGSKGWASGIGLGHGGVGGSR